MALGAQPRRRAVTAARDADRGTPEGRPEPEPPEAALISAGLKANRCEVCGIEEWLGAPLSMALHHVNGDGSDNRLENLQMLCPNCHSQTENFAGRKRGRANVKEVPMA
jgi:hypothetical protein